MKKDYTHIIASRLRGTISPSEKEDLDRWLDASPDNQKIFDAIASIWTLTEKETIVVNTEEEWNQFLAKRDTVIGESKSSYSLGKSRSFFFKAAAVIVPIMILSSVYFFLRHQSAEKQWITITSRQEKMRILLPDQSEVWMNKNTKISYAKNFPKNREVEINGEAFFSVTKNGSTFRVNAGKSIIQVVGTRFNVNNMHDTITQVSVDEGKVIFQAKTDKKKSIILVAGDKGTYSEGKNALHKETMAGTNDGSWVTRKLVFFNTPLFMVKHDLEKYFSVQIRLSDNMSTCMFSGEFENPGLQNILDVLCLATGCEVTSQNNVIILKGDTCPN